MTDLEKLVSTLNEIGIENKLVGDDDLTMIIEDMIVLLFDENGKYKRPMTMENWED